MAKVKLYINVENILLLKVYFG